MKDKSLNVANVDAEWILAREYVRGYHLTFLGSLKILVTSITKPIFVIS